MFTGYYPVVPWLAYLLVGMADRPDGPVAAPGPGLARRRAAPRSPWSRSWSRGYLTGPSASPWSWPARRARRRRVPAPDLLNEISGGHVRHHARPAARGSGCWWSRRTARRRSTSPTRSAASLLVIGAVPAPGRPPDAIRRAGRRDRLRRRHHDPLALHPARVMRTRVRPARGDPVVVPAATSSRCWRSARSTSTAAGAARSSGWSPPPPAGRGAIGTPRARDPGWLRRGRPPPLTGDRERRDPPTRSRTRPRSALVWPRCFLASSRRCRARARRLGRASLRGRRSQGGPQQVGEPFAGGHPVAVLGAVLGGVDDQPPVDQPRAEVRQRAGALGLG